MDAVLSRTRRTHGGDRPPAVAGAFYPADRRELRALVDDLLDEVAGPRPFAGLPAGILVPHAGLVYSGSVAASAWRLLAGRASDEPAAAADAPPGARASDAPIGDPVTVIILGTNHGAAWVDGIGAWPDGSWRMPLGAVAVDAATARAIADLGPPFVIDPDVHADEHSIEVQLPIVWAVDPGLRIVPLAVSTGIGPEAIAAGARLGGILRARRAAGDRIVLAISTDMAHYPPADVCARATQALLPALEALLPDELAAAEAAIGRGAGSGPGMVCGMCGIEPAVLGLAALRAMGAKSGVAVASATSADAGADPARAVGYLGMAFGD